MKRILYLLLFFLLLWSVGQTQHVTKITGLPEISGWGHLERGDSSHVDMTALAESLYVIGWGLKADGDSSEVNLTQIWLDSLWNIIFNMVDTTVAKIPTATLADSCVHYDTANTATYTEVRTAINDTSAVLRTALTDTTWDMKNGFVWSGAQDFGTATSIALPHGQNPTTDAHTEIAYDTDNQAFEVYDSVLAVSVTVPVKMDKDATISNPSAVTAINIPFFHVDVDRYPFGIKLLSITFGQSAAGSDTMVLHEYSTDSTFASTIDSAVTTAREDKQTTITDSDIASDAWIFIHLSNVTATWVSYKISFYVKEGD